MISITGKKWEEIRTNKNSVDKIKQDHNFSEILSKLVISRNFDQDEMYSIENDVEIKKSHLLGSVGFALVVGHLYFAE